MTRFCYRDGNEVNDNISEVNVPSSDFRSALESLETSVPVVLEADESLADLSQTVETTEQIDPIQRLLQQDISREDMELLISRAHPRMNNRHGSISDKIHNADNPAKNIALAVIRQFPNARIYSMARTEAHNRRLRNSADDSDHMYGLAVDFIPQSSEIAAFVRGLFNGHVLVLLNGNTHVSYRENGEKFTDPEARIQQLTAYSPGEYDSENRPASGRNYLNTHYPDNSDENTEPTTGTN